VTKEGAIYVDKARSKSNLSRPPAASKRLAMEIEERLHVPARDAAGRPVLDGNGEISYVTGTAAAATYMAEIACGRDPMALPGSEGGVPPDWTTRRQMFSHLLDRFVGKPKAHVVLEGAVAVGVTSVSVSGTMVPNDALDVLSPKEIADALGADLPAYNRARKAILERKREKMRDLQRLEAAHRSNARTRGPTRAQLAEGAIDAESVEVDREPEPGA
jgi:hypothetical protein